MLRDYWNWRYTHGDNSGHGSIGKERKWKWNIIQQYVKIKDCSVLDIGCGNLSFWGDIRPKRYIGVDYSNIIITKNKTKYYDLCFYCEDLTKPQINMPFVDVIFCFDVLFHQPNTHDFLKILSYLNSVNGKILFLTNLENMPLKSSGHMSYRALKNYLDFISNWSIIKTYVSLIDQKLFYVFQK